jgi:hypothetical protein
MPAEPVGGTSCEPVRVAVNAIVSALATADTINIVTTSPIRLIVFFISSTPFLVKKADAAPQPLLALFPLGTKPPFEGVPKDNYPT